MEVLITGGSGFIGRFLVEFYIKKLAVVNVIGRSQTDYYKNDLIKYYSSDDITVGNLLKIKSKLDLIIHCAGPASVIESLKNPKVSLDKSVNTTSEVLEFIRIHTPTTKLVYLSSAAVYGNSEILPIEEVAKIEPISAYGYHKAITESLCKLYSKEYGISIGILRPFSVYGDGLKKQLMWDACNKLKSGYAEFYGTGRELRDLLHVTDLINLVFNFATYASSECPIINAGSGIGVSVREIIEKLAIGFVNSKVEFTGLLRSGDPVGFIADIKAAKKIGWTPEVNWMEGVESYLRWYLKNEN